MPTLADSRGLGVSEMPTSAIFELNTWYFCFIILMPASREGSLKCRLLKAWGVKYGENIPTSFMDGPLPSRALLLLEIGFLGRTNVPHPSWKYSTTKTSTSTYVTSDLPTSRGQSGRIGLPRPRPKWTQNEPLWTRMYAERWCSYIDDFARLFL